MFYSNIRYCTVGNCQMPIQHEIKREEEGGGGGVFLIDCTAGH